MGEQEIAARDEEAVRALARLRRVCDDMGSVLVAYSGGVDSSLLLAVATQQLGDRAAGAIAVSPTLPRAELEDALAQAREHRWRIDVVETHEMLRPGYASNGPDRCFHCKDELFTVLAPLRDSLAMRWLAYGANTDDALDHRPGAGAARRHAVRSPLVEAGMDKRAIRGAARLLGLASWNRPAFACLASRVQYAQPITAALLDRIGHAEEWLSRRGFTHVRVRVHGDAARVEVEPGQVSRLTGEPLASELASALRALGFAAVTIDPHGYRRGSMNLAQHGGHRLA